MTLPSSMAWLLAPAALYCFVAIATTLTRRLDLWAVSLNVAEFSAAVTCHMESADNLSTKSHTNKEIDRFWIFFAKLDFLYFSASMGMTDVG